MTLASSATSLPAPLRVAHVVRPAQGGMITQVRTLIHSLPDVPARVAASARVLDALGRSSDSGDLTLPETALSYRHHVAWGHRVGMWARKAQIEVLHGHGVRWAPLFWRAATAARVPYVLTLHNLLPQMSGTMGRAALRFCLARAARLIAVSEAVATGARELLGAKARVTTIPNGIDTQSFDRADAVTCEAARGRLGIPVGAPVALCVARLSPEKNVAAFVEAAKMITRGSLPTARFLIAGHGPERGRLAAQIEALELQGRVTLLGVRDDIPALLCAADVVCIPSRAEGFGLVAIEAMAASRPVVATAVGGLPEVIVAGETGLLVPEDSIASAITALLTNPKRAERMGIAGRARVESRYRAETMAAATRAVYTEVLGR